MVLGCSDTIVTPETRLLLRLVDSEGLLANSDEVVVHLEGPVTLVRSVTSGDSILVDDLNAGTYQVAAEAFVGGEVMAFGDRSVEVVEERTADVSVPLRAFIPEAEATTEGDRVTLSWSPVDGAAAYRVEASGLPDTDGYVDQGETEETTFQAGSLPAGEYAFRVRAVNRLGNAGAPVELSVTRRDHALRVLFGPGYLSYGTVQSDPPGIDCGWEGYGPCSAVYAEGTQVTLDLEWEYGTYQQPWTFGGWSGAGCSGFDPCVVTMDGNKEVQPTATEESGTLEVAIDVQAPEGFTETVFVRSNPGKVDCRQEYDLDHNSEQCFYPFPFGIVVELQVTDSNDEQGLTDVAWEGCDGTEGWICRLEIREGAPLSVTATVTYE